MDILSSNDVNSLLTVFQDGRPIEDYVEEFLDLSYRVSLNERALKTIFWGRLDDLIYQQMPAFDTICSLERYIEYNNNNNNNNNSLHLYSAFLLFSKHSNCSTLWGGCLLVHHHMEYALWLSGSSCSWGYRPPCGWNRKPRIACCRWIKPACRPPLTQARRPEVPEIKGGGERDCSLPSSPVQSTLQCRLQTQRALPSPLLQSAILFPRPTPRLQFPHLATRRASESINSPKDFFVGGGGYKRIVSYYTILFNSAYFFQYVLICVGAVNPLQGAWLTGDLTNHNVVSTILSDKQTRQESRLTWVDLNLKRP